MARYDRSCILCGKVYEYCNSCSAFQDKPVWMFSYCSEDCKDITSLLTDFIYNKISKEEVKQAKDYSHLRTITSLNRLCYGVMKLRKIFKQIKYEKYFFENSESLKKFVLIVYISSLINLYLCVVSPPGSGKTTAARAIAEIRARIISQNSQNIPFYIHTHHSTTKTNDFYGTTTISDSEVIFKEGSLTSAITEGSVYIADEFNISSELNMKSVTPVLEQTFNQDLIIPGIEGITSIDPNFFL